MDTNKEHRPRVLALRPESQAAELADLLTQFEMEAVVVPIIRIIPGDVAEIDRLLKRPQDFAWVVFTSANGAAAIADRARELNAAINFRRVAAIGTGTKKKLEARGISVEWLPSSYTTRALGEELPQQKTKPRVAVVRADIAGAEMDDILRKRGFEVTRINAYRTEDIAGTRLLEELEAGIDAIAFTSASIVNAYVRAADSPSSQGAAVCSIGPATSVALRSAGIRIDVEAKIHSSEGLVEAIREHLGSLVRRGE